MKKTWFHRLKHFMFDDDSAWSWLFDILVAFVLIKFLVYPGLGLVLSTSHPIVAVVSGSMEHDGSFDAWWGGKESFYIKLGITRDSFMEFPFRNGFNTGDIMILKGKDPKDIKVGEVIVYQGKNAPIIHRVVKKWYEDGYYYFQAKGDHNSMSNFNEVRIREDQIIGYQDYDKGSVALFRIPFLGYIKIVAVWLVGIFWGMLRMFGVM